MDTLMFLPNFEEQKKMKKILRIFFWQDIDNTKTVCTIKQMKRKFFALRWGHQQ